MTVALSAELRVQRWTALSAAFAAGMVALVAVLAFLPTVVGENTVRRLTQVFFLVVLAMMWNALAGFGGLVSVGQQAFIGLGAYGVVFLAVQHTMNPYLAMLLAALVSGAIAIPVAIVVLQLRGGAFAIATWVVAEVFGILVSLDQALGGGTGTSVGIPFYRYSPVQRERYTYWAALGSAVFLLALLFVLLRSRLGLSLQAIRDDEEAAASVGVRVLAGKGILFVVAAVGCGAAGAIIAAWQLSITAQGPDSVFGVDWTASMFFMVLVGGLGTFEGPIAGAIVLFGIQTYLGGALGGVWYFILLGSIFIGFALLLPRGLWGTVVDRFGVRLLPVGYRVTYSISKRERSAT